MPELNRRGLLTGLVCLMAAPAIVRYGNLMPVKVLPQPTALELLWAEMQDYGHLRYFTKAQVKAEGTSVVYDQYLEHEGLIPSSSTLIISGVKDVSHDAAEKLAWLMQSRVVPRQ